MLPSWRASSAAENDRTISSRPGTGARAFSARTSETPERRETINSWWDLEAARFGAKLDLLRRAHRLGDDVIAAETEADQRGDRSVLIIAPVALGAAGRERVAGHEVAILKGALGLIVQRRADVLDRIDEVQAVREQLQVGLFRGQRGRRRHLELREIEQRTGMRRADRLRRAEAARSPRSRRGASESASVAGGAVDRDELVELGVRDRDRRHHLGVGFDRHRLQDGQHDVVDAGKKFRKRVARGRGVEQQLRVDDVLVAFGIEREDAHAGAEFEIDDVDRAPMRTIRSAVPKAPAMVGKTTRCSR